jgi:Ca2+-binding RTX toxin-like protein
MTDIIGTAESEFIFGTIFDDNIYAFDGEDLIDAGDGDDLVEGGNGNDQINGRGGINRLYGGEGDDFFFIMNYLGAGGIIDGGVGFDTLSISISAETADQTINLSDLWSGGSGTVGTIQIFNIESLDSISLGSGNDTLIIGASYTLGTAISAGAGSDSIIGSSGADGIFGGSGDDVISGGNGDDLIDGGEGRNTLYGGEGNDFLFGSGTLYGDNGDDYIRGGVLNDLIYGGDGNDNIDGLLGSDIIFAGAGDDRIGITTLFGPNGTIDGGDGIDVLEIALGFEAQSFSINLSSLWSGGTGFVGTTAVTNVESISDNTIRTGSGNDTIIIGADYLQTVGIDSGFGNDILVGGSGNDVLDGGYGADRMTGGRGDDLYFVRDESDVILESANQGNDTIQSEVSYTLPTNVENISFSASFFGITGIGNSQANKIDGGYGNDVLNGLGGNDVIFGYIGNDIINGGDGNDRLQGGIGTDRLTGGRGSDRFVWDANDVYWEDIGIEARNIDVITDFKSSQGDRIDLSALGQDSLKFRGTKSFSGREGELRYERRGNNCLIQADRDGDGLADFSILLENVTSLKKSDFILKSKSDDTEVCTELLDLNKNFNSNFEAKTSSMKNSEVNEIVLNIENFESNAFVNLLI